MKNLRNIGEKIHGKVQQVKGSIEVSRGHYLKGNLDKLKGKVTEMTADLKMK